MTYPEVTIAPKDSKRGRAFSAVRLATVRADKLWPGGQTKTNDIERPVLAVFAASDDTLRAFAANLRLGHRADLPENARSYRVHGYEFLRGAGYRQVWQREPEGTVLTVLLPELFALDPGMVDPKEVKFVLLPSAKWLAAQQGIDTQAVVAHALRTPFVRAMNATVIRNRWGDNVAHEPEMPAEKLEPLVAPAYLFAAYLDRRTRAPILPDGRFYLQVFLACLKGGLATWTTSHHGNERQFGCHSALGFTTVGVEEIGFSPGVAFKATHEQIEALLAEETALYFKLTKGKTR